MFMCIYRPPVNHLRVHTHVQPVKFLNCSAQAGNSCLELVENSFPDDRLFVKILKIQIQAG